MNDRSNVAVEVNNRYPEYLKTNTHESCATFLWLVCDELQRQFPNEHWGLLTKNSGENGYTWPSGMRTSHDAICIPNGERVDIISGAGSGAPTGPSWGVVPQEQWRPHNVWVDYRNVNGDVPNGGNGGTTPEDALSKAFRQLDENNRFLRRVAGIWEIPFP